MTVKGGDNLPSRLAGVLPPIDSITPAIRDANQITSDAAAACNLGFGGKLLIHPAQVAPGRSVFWQL